MKRALLLLVLVACGPKYPRVPLTEHCPTQPADYEEITDDWTRKGDKQDVYQEIASVAATFKSPDWRLAKAARDADRRGLTGPQRQALLAQACADMAGPYEVEVMLTTWDRRENDLDRGKTRSIWRVVLIDEQGNEIEYLEIVKDKRPAFTVRTDFPAFGDFAVAYIARFPRPAADKPPILGPGVKKLRFRMSSNRGAIELNWDAP